MAGNRLACPEFFTGSDLYMPTSTNANAPQKEYGNANKETGAAFRPSITYDQALMKLNYECFQERLKTVLGRKPSEGASKPFHSDPWSAHSSRPHKGKEFDLARDNGWRAIYFNQSWFLAKHKGAYNDFEFWHISNPPAPTMALPSISSVGASVGMNAAPVTTTAWVDSISDDESSVPVVTLTSKTEKGWDDEDTVV
jgi:hypothetical protein